MGAGCAGSAASGCVASTHQARDPNSNTRRPRAKPNNEQQHDQRERQRAGDLGRALELELDAHLRGEAHKLRLLVRLVPGVGTEDRG
eukprot:1336904-Rhodomonas_salina.1